MTFRQDVPVYPNAAAGMEAESVSHSRYPARRVRRLGVTAAARDVRVVHPLDGILDAVDPQTVRRVGDALWATWSAHPASVTPDILLGLDAGGIPPTLALSLASGLPYRLAWKLDLALPHKRQFIEPHARRTEVYAYGDLAGARVLIVDDETTTGKTFCNLVDVLRAASADVVGAACLVEDTNGGARERLAGRGIPLCTLTRL